MTEQEAYQEHIRYTNDTYCRSDRLLPYDTIVKTHEGDPEAIQAVLDR